MKIWGINKASLKIFIQNFKTLQKIKEQRLQKL